MTFHSPIGRRVALFQGEEKSPSVERPSPRGTTLGSPGELHLGLRNTATVCRFFFSNDDDVDSPTIAPR